MQDVGDARLWRVAYAEGVLEIRMPRQQHEQSKIMLANFVEAIADALEIEILELGALLLELWQYSNNQLEVYILRNGEYQLSKASLLFPFLPIAAIPDFIERGQDMGQRTAVRLFRERIQALLANSSEPESIGTFELKDNLTGELKKDHP
jgi:hypothetical protein